MVYWNSVFTNSLWVTGLAIVLTVFSFATYQADKTHSGMRAVLSGIASSGWTRLGACLFCAGMALTGVTALEQFLWGALFVCAGIDWIRLARKKRARRIQGTGDTGPTDASYLPPPEESKPAAAGPRGVRLVAEWIVRLELLWLLLASPVFLFPQPGCLALLALAALPSIWVARRVARGRFIPRTPLDWPICLLLVMVLVSALVTFDLSYSLHRITVLLFSVGLFYAIVDWAITPRRIGWVMGVYVLLGFGFSLLGLLGVNWTRLLGEGFANKLFPMLGQFRGEIPPLLRGLPDAHRWLHPNEVGGALLWVVPLQFALLIWCWSARFGTAYWRWLVRIVVLPMTFLTGATMVMSQARGVLAGFVIGMALLAWMLSTRWLRIALAALALVALGALLYLGPQRLAEDFTPGDSGLGFGLSLLDSERSLEGRVLIWSRAIYAIEDFPLTGIGLDTFRFIQPSLYPIDQSLDTNTSHPHNQFLGAALELGLPGLVGFLALWMVASGLVAQLWRAARTARNRWARFASAGIGACLLAYFIYALTDVVSLGDRPGVLFWSLLGLLVVAWRQTRQQASMAA
ncbi:MAG: O-antigen ligase family protein [Chloroflexia bacterium]